MCTAENIISGIIVATTSIIGAGAVLMLVSLIINDYKEKKNK